jgi:hypothetical protein
MATYSGVSHRALSNEEIGRYAPSVLALEAHESRSERYTYIPTIQIVDGLRDHGWMPVSARQSRSRDAGRKAFTKHMLRFRHEHDLGRKAEVDGLVGEIVLVNSHDGSSSYQLHAGIFRFICANGMVVADSLVGQQRVHHKGNIVDNVIEGVFGIVKELPKVMDAADGFKQIGMTMQDQEAFGQAAMALRWEKPEETGLNARQIIAPRRFGDDKPDLWSTYNRAQENLIKGGGRLRGYVRTLDEATGRSKIRRTSARAVNGIDQDVKLNKALWTLTEYFAQLKGVIAG